MSKKIAFFDIDGTLINVPHGIMQSTEKVKQALRDFKNKGNYIVIATARGLGIEKTLDIDFDGYIFKDGHYICFHDEVLINDYLSTKQVEKQEKVYRKTNGKPMYYGINKEWNRHLDNELVIQHREMFAGTRKRPTGVCEEFQPQDVKAQSCCVLFETAEQMWEAYHELEDELTMIPYATGLIRIDVYNKGFTKGTACEYLYKKLNIDYENTYAFGDGVNDKEMFELICHSQAMGNAVEELKDIASVIIDTVDNDGIAKYLNEIKN